MERRYSTSFWLEWLTATILLSITLTICYFMTNDGSASRCAEYEWPQHLLVLAQILEFISQRFQAAVGLMLGFYTSTCYGRWASVQQKEGDVQKAIHNTSLRILWKTKFDLQKNDKDEDDNNDDKEEGETTTTTTFSMEEVRGILSELVRLVNLSHGIAVRYLYEGISDVYDGRLLASGLLKEEERDFILLPENSALCGSEYVIPLAWFQDYIGNLVKKKAFRFNDWTVEEFGSSIFDLQRTYDDLVRFKAEPVPLIYTQLVQITVRVYLIFLFVDGIFFDLINNPVSECNNIAAGSFWDIFKYLFEYFLFIGWLTAASAMSNPFRKWSDEIDWDSRVIETYKRSSCTVGLVS